jgi:hypothetical protein
MSDDGVWLDVLGILDGVDKASLRGEVQCSWDYLRHYAHALHEYRDQELNVLEIGVYAGASLNMWLRYFTKATIVGVDINPTCAALARGRAIVKIGAQEDKAFMTEVARAHPPTVVIDDGSHLAIHIIRSFEAVFPLLLPGGTYIVEDLAFHFAFRDGQVVAVQPSPGQPDNTPPVFDFFSRLIAAKAAHVTRLKDASEEMNRLYASIDSISIVGGALFIRKRVPRDLDKYVVLFEDELRSRAAMSRSYYHYLVVRYAEFLIVYQHNLARALQLLQGLLAHEPDNVLAAKLLYKALQLSGRPQEADAVRARLATVNQDIAAPTTYVPEQMIYPHG